MENKEHSELCAGKVVIVSSGEKHIVFIIYFMVMVRPYICPNPTKMAQVGYRIVARI